MKIELNQSDWEKVMQIAEVRTRNFEVIGMYSYFLTNHASLITKELIDPLLNCEGLSEEYAFFGLLASACGLDAERNQRDLQIAREYFIPSIKKLELSTYQANPYYQKIKIPERKLADWEFRTECYQPYQAFIYNDIQIEQNFREIPQLGFFNQVFSFPAVLQAGQEWMTITPNEIETMQPVIDVAQGKVITFGLGLGYFPYMISKKEEVSSVTVVEKDVKVIRLFQKYILPQFSHPEKVSIIQMDAFEYIENFSENGKYDLAFADLWHNVSDGLDCYLRLKKLERYNYAGKYFYWIEDSMLSHLRWYVFQELLKEKRAANTSNLPTLFKSRSIHSFDEFTYYLSNPFLKELACEISKIEDIHSEYNQDMLN